MPLFTYQCTGCGAESEILVQSASASPACPSCGGKEMAKQASVFAPPSSAAEVAAGPRCQSCPSAGGACPYQS